MNLFRYLRLTFTSAIVAALLLSTCSVPVSAQGQSQKLTDFSPEIYADLNREVRSELKRHNRTLEEVKSYHWVFLMQVARYESTGDARVYEMRNAVGRFLEALATSRQNWQQPNKVLDTVSIIPYHFHPISSASHIGLPLAKYTDNVGQLSSLLPSEPFPDAYLTGTRYTDGHDWRRGFMEALPLLKDKSENLIVVVMDWNDAPLPPSIPSVVGAKQVKNNRTNLVSKADNSLLWRQYTDRLDGFGFEERALTPEFAGNPTSIPNPTDKNDTRSYALGVFTPKNFSAIGEEATPAVTPLASPTSTEQITSAEVVGGNNYLPWILLALAVLLVVVLFILLGREVSVSIDGIPYRLHLFKRKIPIMSAGSPSGENVHILASGLGANAFGGATLARLSCSLLGTTSINGVEMRVVPTNSGSEANGSETGVRMIEDSCEVQIQDGQGSVVATLNIRVARGNS